MLIIIVLICLFGSAISVDDSSVRFLLNGQGNYISSQNISLVDVKKPTIFLAHGYTETSNAYYYKEISDEFLLKGSYNIIGMDWAELASGPDFLAAADNVSIAGNAMGKMIINLHAVGLNLSRVHLIGHSLGAHVVGFAGKYVKAKLKVTLGKITALDAAGLNFLLKGDDGRLSSTDADDVVVLHTDNLGFGFGYNIGTVDFYANFGIAPQPGCYPQDKWDVGLTEYVFCSHQISVKYFIYSINSNEYVATCTELFGCGSRSLIFGPDVPAGSKGKYFFNTY